MGAPKAITAVALPMNGAAERHLSALFVDAGKGNAAAQCKRRDCEFCAAAGSVCWEKAGSVKPATSIIQSTKRSIGESLFVLPRVAISKNAFI